MKNACFVLVCLSALISLSIDSKAFNQGQALSLGGKVSNDMHAGEVCLNYPELAHLLSNKVTNGLILGDEAYLLEYGHVDGGCAFPALEFPQIDPLDLDALEVPGNFSAKGAASDIEALEESLLWWWTVFLGRGYVINGGNIVMRASPLMMSQFGLHAWASAQAAMGLLYVASMYAKLIEKAELGDANVVNGIKGKANIDIGKTAGFYLDMMMITLDYVRKLRLERLGAVVIKEGEQMASDQWGDVLSDLLVGASWVAQLNSVAMNTASLTTKFYKVAELEEKGSATDVEMERAWNDVYVYIAKLGGGLVGLGAKFVYTYTGCESRSMRYSAMFLSVLGSGLFLYWDMGGLFSEVS